MKKALKIRLSDESTILIDQVAVAAEQEVAHRDLEVRLKSVMPTVAALGRDLVDGFKKAAPTKATVEFGLSFSLETSGLALLVAKGDTEANFKIALEWERPKA